MAGVAEVTVFLNKLESLDFLYQSFKQIDNKYGIKIKELFIIDNWNFDNKRKADFYKRELIQDITNYNILIGQLIVKEKHSAGFRINRFSEEVYEITYFINSKNIPEIYYGSSITEENKSYFEELTSIVTSNISRDDLILAGIGIEPEIKYYPKNVEVMKNSLFVLRWILPSKNYVISSKTYEYEKHRGFIVYTIK